jgi:O-antigen/teichoic acid export membrane protein
VGLRGMNFRSKLAPLTARLSLAAVAPLVGFSSRFLRTVLLSHFLAPGELGVAITITVVVTTSELISEVGLNHLVLVRSGEEAREFLAAAHLLQLARGMIISTVLAALCVPISSLFGISQLWKSFLVAALLPLTRSFYHLGVYQIQREYQYRPYALSVGISSIAGLGAAVLLVFWIPDHRTILISLGCETLLFVILSHLLTPIRYECHATASVLREVLKYGLPLTANGIALALISQVDRILVAGVLGVETLAVYAVVVGLAQTPISPIFEIFGTLGMAMMVRSKASPDQELASFAWLMWLFSLLAFAYAAAVGLTLDLLAPLIYGPHYAVPQSWRVFITVSVFLATYRGAHTVLLLSQGHTGKLAIANATVGLGVLAAALAVRVYPMPEAILAGKLFGDIVSIAVFHWAVFASLKASWRTVVHCLVFSLCSIGLFIFVISSSPNPTWSTRILLAAVYLPPLSLLLWRAYSAWRIRQLTFSAEAVAAQ